jgi:DNA-binding GntR family transcriptional regulator
LRSSRVAFSASRSIVHGDEEWEVAVLTAFHRLSLAEKRLGSGPVALDDDWSERHRAYHMALLSATPSALLSNMMDVFIRAKATSIRGAPFDAEVESMGVSWLG